MDSFLNRILVYTLVVTLSISSLLLSGSVVAAGCDTDYLQGEKPIPGVMLVDAVVVRPLTLVASVAGAALWVVSLPFTLLGGNTAEAGDVLVRDPLCYTFKRPLGYLDDGR
jgi:ABC-type sulfate transport system permease component